MKQKKFTIVYRDIRQGNIICKHAEGRMWSEASNNAVSDMVLNERKEQGRAPLDLDDIGDRGIFNYLCSKFEIIACFEGHQKPII